MPFELETRENKAVIGQSNILSIRKHMPNCYCRNYGSTQMIHVSSCYTADGNNS